MKGQGTKIFFILFFLVLTGYYLSFSVRYWLEERQMDAMSEEERSTYMEENRERLDNLRSRILTLGLDLQGGMHVTLELAANELVLELARDYRDEQLEDIVRVAHDRAQENNTDFLDEFIEEFESRDENARMSRYFRSDEEGITARSENSEVIAYLRGQQDEAIVRALEIVRNRIDRFGVAEPSIMRQGGNRIIAELPGVDDEQRVRDLLSGTARLEFRLAPDPEDVMQSFQRIAEHYDAEDDAEIDQEELIDLEQDETENRLLSVLMPPQGQTIVFGYATEADTSEVNSLLRDDQVRGMLPSNSELKWTANPMFENYYALVTVNANYELTGDVITDARPDFDPQTNAPQVSMTMNRQGSRTWSRITGANIGRPVVVLMDDFVYTFPNIRTQIADGRTSITGLESIEEAEDLVTILMSGSLPVSLDIVEERTIGPSLGEESVRAGFTSAVSGLALVILFMMFYYRQGGAIADIALVLNILFIFGILAAFNATLTLPGIAGIVLTIGMAVDANVLIFDRIREEQRVGKSLQAAIDSGYSNAMSAILDANITTFLTAVILFSFGVGPIKGFAITLMAGIIASLFSAIVITRLVVDYLTKEKKLNLSFG